MDHPGEPLQWFHSKEKQAALIRNLRILKELDYEPPPGEIGAERREAVGSRTLTLFLFSGDPLLLDHLQSQIQLQEHDIIERYGQGEIRGVLVHLKKVNLSEVEGIFRRIMEDRGLRKLKGLLMPIHSPKGIEGDLFNLIHTTLRQMTDGELKTISI